MALQPSRPSRRLLSQIAVLTDVNEPELVDGGKVAAIHFFVRQGFQAVGEIVFWLGRRGQAQGLPVRVRLREEGEDGAGGGGGRGRAGICGDLVGDGEAWVEGVLSVGHVSNIGTRSARDVVGRGRCGGGTAGARG